MKKLLRLLIVTISLIAVVFFAFNYAVNNITPYSIIKPFRRTNPVITDFFKRNAESFDITTNDSIKLYGYFIKSKSSSSFGTIILLHGIGDNKESNLALTEFLAQNGYNSLIFDLRAHGQSTGSYCTYGYYEKMDVSQYISEFIKRYPNKGPVGIFGHSLGGAIAIQTLAIDKRIKCGIAASTFSNLRQVAFDYMERMTYIPFKYVSDKSIDKAAIIANFRPDSIDNEIYAGKITQPVLVIHGTNDKNIPMINGCNIFKCLKTRSKELYLVKNAGHNDLYSIGGKSYLNKILNFFNNYLRENTSSSSKNLKIRIPSSSSKLVTTDSRNL